MATYSPSSWAGDLDSTSTPEFNRRVWTHLDAGHSKIIIDCRNMGYISSIGIGSLVALQQTKTGSDEAERSSWLPFSAARVMEVMHLGASGLDPRYLSRILEFAGAILLSKGAQASATISEGMNLRLGIRDPSLEPDGLNRCRPGLSSRKSIDRRIGPVGSLKRQHPARVLWRQSTDLIELLDLGLRELDVNGREIVVQLIHSLGPDDDGRDDGLGQ